MVGGSVCERDSRAHGPGAYTVQRRRSMHQSLPLKAERKSRSSKRRLEVNLVKRTRADFRALLRRVRVKGTHRLYKAAPRRFLLQIDTRTKRQQMVHIFRDGRRKKTAQGSTPRLSPENCFFQIWARCTCRRFRDFWSPLKSERRKTANSSTSKPPQ